ncbi:MAG TPA: NAD-dependent epimerase/dehydratase family protein [Solirubrobacteraceae bacterium]|nr:NAD-dependent epimerase/dehydratase family protein [Solirubrobacteraceae bacterium]
MSRHVLVTGGAGFIGGHVAEAYRARGDRVWVVDDLSTGRRANVPPGVEFIQLDIGDPALDRLFHDVRFDLVNHHAAQIDVRRSVADPRLDARINIDGFLNVAECALRHGVRRFVFVSSGGVVYGEPERRPTPETEPKAPLSPYGVTKLATEQYLFYYNRIRGLDYVALRYSNVYGPRQDPHGEAGVVAIFASRLVERQALTIYGDGEQTRDYVYVGDVVRANLAASDATLPEPVTLDDRAFNVGTGSATSVNMLATEIARAADRDVDRSHAAERPGELRDSCLDCGKAARLLRWSAATPLHEGLDTTYRFIAREEENR